MKRTWTIIGVSDVARSFKWYQRLFEEKPHLNPNTQTMEFSLRDPDSNYVTISALDAPNVTQHGKQHDGNNL